MEVPGNRSGESVGPVEDPPPSTTTIQDQSTSDSSSQPQQQQQRPLPPLSPLTGCYLLIVVGEPHSERHKEIILQKIAKAFLSWDINECHVSLEKELEVITGQSPEGEEARFGERLIQYATENLVTEILIHPQLNTLHQCMKNLLSSFTKHRHIIHAGYTFAKNGSWILQDGTLSISDLVEALHEPEVLRVLKAYENSVSIDVHCAPEGDWATERFQKEPVSKLCNIRINPGDVMTAGNSAISAFINYLAPFLEPANIQQLLQPTDVVGNIRFTHPTLYIFPGGQGDAALFGINGFNMLIDGGFARKACFWDFARHLDRLDAVLLTRLNNSTINGISAVLQRKKLNHVYPQIGHFFCNLQDRKIALSPDGDKDKDSLIVNLAEEGQEIVANLRHLALKPHPCYRDGNQVDPVNLYHKVGHGKLDMYVISPARDSQAVKEFLAKWSSNDGHLFSQTGKKITGKTFEFPLQNLVSICALLVWQPANPNDTITRILFPGSTPQHKIFEGLEKLRHLEFLKHPVCSAKSISPSTSTGAINRSVSKTRQPKVIDNKQKETKVISKPQVKPVKPKVEKTPVKDVKPKLDVNKLADEKNDLETIKESVKKVENIENPLKKLDNRILSKDEQIENIRKEIQKIEQTDNEEQKKKNVHRSKYDMRFVKSKVDSRAPSKSIERKKIPEKKADGEISPSGTPKKNLINGTATKQDKAKIGTKPSKAPFPLSTPAKSAKEANNRKVVEARVNSRLTTKSTTRKKEKTPPLLASAAAEADRKPISRRPKASLSPVKSSAEKPLTTEPESMPKNVKKPDIDSTIIKAVSQTISKELEKGSVTEKTEVEEKKDRVIDIKKLEAETENKETDEMAVKGSDLGSARVEEPNKNEEEHEEEDEDEEEEEEEEYLIVTKEESTEESAKEDEIEEAQTKDETEGEGEMKKLLREEEESEKKRELMDKKDIKIEETEQRVDEKDVEDATGEKDRLKEKKTESLEENITKERESEEQKFIQLDEGIDLKEPASKEHKEGESLPEEKISNTLETSATTAPTLPEDERIEELIESTKDHLEETNEAVEEKYVQEETKEEKKDEDEKPEQSHPVSTADDEGFPVPIPIVQKKPRDVVKTPDEVADLPMHEEVDPRMYSSGEYTKDLQKNLHDKPDLKEKVGDGGDMMENDKVSESKELKAASPEETKQQEEGENVKDSVTSKYLNIIDELEKTATVIKEKPKKDESGKPEDLKTDDRKPSLQKDEIDKEFFTPENVEKESPEKTTYADASLKNVSEVFEKVIPFENNKLRDSDDFIMHDVEKLPSEKSITVDREKDISSDAERQSSLSPVAQPKESSRTFAPDNKDLVLEASNQPTLKDVPENLSKSVPLEVSGESTSRDSTEEPREKSPTKDKDLIEALSRERTTPDSVKNVFGKASPTDVAKNIHGKSSPENFEEKLSVNLQERTSGKSELQVLDKEETPDKSTVNFSEKSAPAEFAKDDSENASVKDLNEEGFSKLEPEKLSKDVSRTSTPVESIKDASGKASPQDLCKEISEEIASQERELQKRLPQNTEEPISQESNFGFTVSPPLNLDKTLLSTLSPQKKLENLSGKSSPKDSDQKDSTPEVSGKSTPSDLSPDITKKSSFSEQEGKEEKEEKESDSKKISLRDDTGKGTPLEVTRESTCDELIKKVSGESTPEDLEKKADSQLPQLETSGKSTPQDLDTDKSSQSTPHDVITDISGKLTAKDANEEGLNKTPSEISEKSMPKDMSKDVAESLRAQNLGKDDSGKSSPKNFGEEEVEDLGKKITLEQPEKLNEDTSRTSTPVNLVMEASGKTTPESSDKQVSRESIFQDSTKDISGKSTPQNLEKTTVTSSITPENSGKTTPNESPLENKCSKSPEPKIISETVSTAEVQKELKITTPKDFTEENSQTPSQETDSPEKRDLEKPVASEESTLLEESKEVSRKSPVNDVQKALSSSNYETLSGKATPEKMWLENVDEIDKAGVKISEKLNTFDVQKSGESTPQDERDSSRPSSRNKSGKMTPESGKEWSGKTSRRESLVSSSNKSSPVPAWQEDHAMTQRLLKYEVSNKTSLIEKAEDINEKSGKISPELEKATLRETIKDVEDEFPQERAKKVADSVSDSVSSGPFEKDLSGKSTPFSIDKEISGKVSPQIGGKITSDSFSLALAEKGTSETYSLEKESCEKVSSPSPVDISPISLDELREDAREMSDLEKNLPESVQGKNRITGIRKTQLEKLKYDETSSGTSTPDRSDLEKSEESLPNGVENEDECEKGILESEKLGKESQILDVSSAEEEELKALEEEEEEEDSEPEIRKGDLEDGLRKEILKAQKDDINRLVKTETEEEQDDTKSGVKRMLVTASSEDGGTETEICIKSGDKTVKKIIDVEKSEKGEKKEAEEEKESDFSNLILQAREEYKAQRSRKGSYNSLEEAEEIKEKAEEIKEKSEEKSDNEKEKEEGIKTWQESPNNWSESRETGTSNKKNMPLTKKTIRTFRATKMEEDDLVRVTTVLTEEREELDNGMVRVKTTKETTTEDGNDQGIVLLVDTFLEKNENQKLGPLKFPEGYEREELNKKQLKEEATSSEEVTETSRRTSASSMISQEDLVSQKDSVKSEDFKPNSTEMSPLKTTHITSHDDSESLMTSSFYGNLPTEDEMIGRAEHSRNFKKEKDYESFMEIGPNGERTERTYFYEREDDAKDRDNKSRFVKAYYTEDVQQKEEEQVRFVHKRYRSDAPEEALEKIHVIQSFYTEEVTRPDSEGKFRFVETVSEEPMEHMDFAKAVDEHMSARGEYLGKEDAVKYGNGKSKPEEEERSGSETKTEDEKKDVIEEWGKPLGLPLPPKNANKNYGFPGQNISTTSSLSTPTENSDSVNNWGQPMNLPSPAPPPTQNGTAETLPGKGINAIKETPKKERKIQLKKNISENNKNSGANTPNRRSESPVKQPEKRTPSTGRSNRSAAGHVYLDLTYVPHHGNSYYSNVEFFKKVRARYYVFSGTEPSKEVYNALLEAKQTWENKQLEVTIIPTYDTDVLGYWVAENEEILAKHKIDLSPSASRCTINLQDHETSCSAYRLEF